MASTTATFTIDVIGETTGEKFCGSFTTKLKLSHADGFRKDEIRRKLIGANPDGASPRTTNSAEVFSECWIHLTETPTWWSGNGNGLDLDDDSVVAAVFGGIVLEKKKHLEAIKAKADEALAALKKVDPAAK